MKNFGYIVGSAATALALPVVASAQFSASGGAFGTFLTEILLFINGVLIPFIIGIGFLFFVWGMFQFFIAGGADEEKREKGKTMMTYSILGFVLIIVFWGIINLIASSTGMDDAGLKNSLVPTTGTIAS